MTPLPRTTTDQWVLLAGIRFFLAFVVLYGHSCELTSNHIPGLDLILQFGAGAAVSGFFMISGFSIAASLERDRHHFYARRFWRIAPIYGACFALAVYARATVPHLTVYEHQTLLVTVLNGLCLNGLVSEPIPSFVVSWTLACEVFYYAVAPLLSRQSKRTVVILCAASIAVYEFRIMFLSSAVAQHEIYGLAYMTMFWFWGLGWAFYKYRDDPRLPWLILAPVFLIDSSGYGVNYWGTETVAGVGLALVYGARLQFSERVRKILNFLGGVSYPLYLVHFPLIAILYDRWGSRLDQSPASYLVLSVAAGILLYLAMDAPIQAVVKHFTRPPERSARPAGKEKALPKRAEPEVMR